MKLNVFALAVWKMKSIVDVKSQVPLMLSTSTVHAVMSWVRL